MLRHARLAEHKHTARLLPHHHTHYHGLILIILLALACAGLIHNRVQAYDLTVSATVPAPIPSAPPTIDSPADGSSSDQPSVTISGSCPIVVPAVIIVAYEGTTALGSQPCNSQGGYSFPIHLSPGNHLIRVTSMTITGDSAGSSDFIRISYNPVQTDNTESSNGLRIVAWQLYIVYWKTRDAIWQGTFEGGTPPYKTTVSWGDGSVDKRSNVSAGKQTLRHHYETMGNYTVRIEVTDQTGAMVFAHIAATTTSQQYITPFRADQPLAGGITAETIAIRLYGTMLAMIAILYVYEHFIVQTAAIAGHALPRRK